MERGLCHPWPHQPLLQPSGPTNFLHIIPVTHPVSEQWQNIVLHSMPPTQKSMLPMFNTMNNTFSNRYCTCSDFALLNDLFLFLFLLNLMHMFQVDAGHTITVPNQLDSSADADAAVKKALKDQKKQVCF